MVCQRCLRALKFLLKPYIVNPKSAFSQKAYRPARIDFSLGTKSICWVCEKLAAWISKQQDFLRPMRGVKLIPLDINVNDLILAKHNVLMIALLGVHLRNARSQIYTEGELEVQLALHVECQLPKSIDTRDSLDTVRSWLRICQLTHDGCHIDETTWFPTRLLYLETQDIIRLILTSEDKPDKPYLTLSHRWGQETYTKLQRSTVEELQRGFRVESLPMTFQDAIWVTRQLGFQYLWIDSLCIIQDDINQADWLREAARMHHVYSHSFLNLSATGAPNSSFSLFNRRDLRSMVPEQTNWKIGTTQLQCFLLDGDMWNEDVANTNLNQRAWVFQERILAHRVLHFGKRQLAWECREFDATELFPSGLPLETYSCLSKQRWGAMLAANSRHNLASRAADALRMWPKIVENYARCDLTKSKDKLIALSGVAQEIGSVIQDQYLAGLWKQSIAFQLPWWREHKLRQTRPRSLVPYRAPSWSWASIDGETLFPGTTADNLQNLVQVTKAELHPVNEQDTTGALESGSIKIKCMLNTLSFINLAENDSYTGMRISKRRFDFPREGSHSFLKSEVKNTDLQNFNMKGELYCVACCSSSEEVCGIVLTHSGEESHYSRIGSFSIDTPEALSHESGDSGADEGEVLLARFLDVSHLHALINALRSGSCEGNSLPCDSYDERSGEHEITIK